MLHPLEEMLDQRDSETFAGTLLNPKVSICCHLYVFVREGLCVRDGEIGEKGEGGAYVKLF